MLVNILCDISTCNLLIDSGMKLCNISRITVHRKTYKTEIKVGHGPMTTNSDYPPIFETEAINLLPVQYSDRLMCPLCINYNIFILSLL